MSEQRQLDFFYWPAPLATGWRLALRRLGPDAPLVQMYGVPGVTTKLADRIQLRQMRREGRA